MSSLRGFNRLNSQREFNKIYSKPTHSWHSEWFVLFYKKSSKKEIAFVASKKVGNAVLRNRAKRLLRAQFIDKSDNLKNGCYIFVAKAPIVTARYQQLDKTFNKIYRRLKLFRDIE